MGSTASALEINLKRVRFFSLWERCLPAGVDADPAPVWEELNAHYNEARRAYHSCGHIRHCLAQLDLADSQVEEPDAIEMAIWFHDIIHRPGEKDNEIRSAELFERTVKPYFSEEFVRKVRELILLTTHRKAPENETEAFLLDIDMSSFGLPWDEFLTDSKALRMEEADVADEVFYAGKLRFLRMLLERPSIYFSQFFHDLYESKAKQNIRRYIAQLMADGYR